MLTAILCRLGFHAAVPMNETSFKVVSNRGGVLLCTTTHWGCERCNRSLFTSYREAPDA